MSDGYVNALIVLVVPDAYPVERDSFLHVSLQSEKNIQKLKPQFHSEEQYPVGQRVLQMVR